MQDDVEAYVRTYLANQQDKVKQQYFTELLEPLPIAERLWESVSMDLFVVLPKSYGYGGRIIVVVDWFKKSTIFIIASTYCKVDEATRMFLKNVMKSLGVPHSIISDRDSRFIGKF